jgi:hypothetical protein
MPIGSGRFDKPWPARIQAISAGGLSLVLSRRFETGTRLNLELENPTEQYHRTLIVRVVKVERSSQGEWNLGCVTDEKLDEDELPHFEAEPPPPEPAEAPAEPEPPQQPEPAQPLEPERAWVRLPCDALTTCYPVGPDHAAIRKVRIVNVSPGGVALLMRRHLQPGTLLTIRVPNGKGSKHRVLARVAHTTPRRNGKVLLGCAFLTDLSDQELQAFLL